MLKKLLIAIALLLLLLVGVGFFMPKVVGLEREVVIDAPPATVYTVASSYARFNEWSPWAKIDPNTEYSYEGPSSGLGAKMAWVSESRDVGVGSQEIIAAQPYERLETRLTFEGQGESKAWQTFEAVEGGTKMKWGFEADFTDNFIGRYFGPMIEGALGPQYEEGLASLKTLVEALPETDFAGLDAELIEVEPVLMAYVDGSTSQNLEAVGEALATAYGTVSSFLGMNGLEYAGYPLAVNRKWEDDVFEFTAGIPIAARPEEMADGSEVQVGETQGGKVVKVVHVGSYANLEQTYEKLEAWLAANGLEPAGDPWDVWVSDPGSTPEDELITHVHFPVG